MERSNATDDTNSQDGWLSSFADRYAWQGLTVSESERFFQRGSSTEGKEEEERKGTKGAFTSFFLSVKVTCQGVGLGVGKVLPLRWSSAAQEGGQDC